jgi:hypothetical protein
MGASLKAENRETKQKDFSFYLNGNHPMSLSKANCSCLLSRLFKTVSAGRSSECRRLFVGKLSNATNLGYLPDSFLPIVHFIWHKANGSTYYQNIIKKALIKFCSNFNEGFDALCNIQFPTQCSVIDWCINVIINNYISETSNLMSGRLKIKYICSANEAIRNWSIRRDSQLQ